MSNELRNKSSSRSPNNNKNNDHLQYINPKSLKVNIKGEVYSYISLLTSL